jgi:penicillin V acylase-like amidase (Ntn superfamily)
MCTRILWDTRGKVFVPVVGRIMDWANDEYRPDIWILPAGGKGNGGTDSNQITWQIKFGSLVVPVTWNVKRNGQEIEVGTSTDGINQQGLAGHTLWLGKTTYPTPDKRSTLNIAKWLQYYLDQFETVKDALADAKNPPYRLVPVPVGTIEGKLHLTLEDSRGDSAVIEYIDGEPHVHSTPDYAVITNSLTCDLQSKATLKEYKAFGGTQELPGAADSRHRFVRAWYYREQLPTADSERETVAYLLSVLRNVSYPFGKFDPFVPQDEAIPSTRWRSIINLTKGENVYYFESTTSPSIFWVELSKLDFKSRQKLDLRSNPPRDLFGDVSGEFKPAPQSFKWPAPGDIVIKPQIPPQPAPTLQ